MTNTTIDDDEIGSFVEDALCDAFNDAGLNYNGQAFTAIGKIIQNWMDDGILVDGTLDVGHYEREL